MSKFESNQSPQNAVVISGVGGRYPESESTDEFAANLFANVDMVTEDDRRWPTDLFEMNQRMGKLKEIDRFDGGFFGWRRRMTNAVDPQGRILIETTYEAICDSGINPQSLRGSRTGVYVGMSTIGMPDGIPNTLDPSSRSSITDGLSWIQGSSKSMYANRISYCFDFCGPSMVIDTACSSSMVALDIAVTDMRSGKCDQAIVSGVNINLQPFTNFFYQKLGFNALNGISKVWDADADGFVRGESVASLFLQHERHSKRIYARIINSRTNIDGYKQNGMFFPSSDGQKNLLVDTISQTNVHPNDIAYFEAHGTGTKAGDFQEANAIYRAYCTNGRTKPLPVGLLKSNIGHGEAASGVASITKVIISFENECIPANLHLKTFKPDIEKLQLLKPIQKNLHFTPGIVGVNSFGIGGVNGHVLLEPNYKTTNEDQWDIASPQVPRLVLLHGRTKEAVEHLMKFIEENPKRITKDFLALIADVFKFEPMVNSPGFPSRASIMIKKVDSENSFKYLRSEIETANIQFRDQLCFFYSGIGGQRTAIAKELINFEVFSSRLAHLSSILEPYGEKLVDLMVNQSTENQNKINSSLVAKFVTTTALQIILTDILIQDLGIVPDVIIGHSFGEIAATYAQGYISAEEALLISYNRGKVLEESRKNIPNGLMAAVGLSHGEALARCPKDVYVACDNAPNLVTISGEAKATEAFLTKLESDGVFVKQLNSSEYPLHTPYLNVVKEKLRKQIENVFSVTRKDPKNVLTYGYHSLKWISTAETQEYMDQLHSCTKHGNFPSQLADYFVRNLLNPVNFNEVVNRLNDSTVIIEISSRELFRNIITKANASFKYLPLQRNPSPTPEAFLSTIADLYRMGFNPSVERLYPQVKWPVSRGTQSISSLLKWDHHDSFFVKRYPDYYFKATSSDLLIEIDSHEPENEYLYHHIIGGRCILPGSAMLFFAWKRYSESAAKSWRKLPVQFEDVQLRKIVYLDKNQKITLKVRLFDHTNEFVIFEGTSIVCTGVIKELKPNNFTYQEMLEKHEEMKATMTTVPGEDIYKDMRARGYEFGAKFRNIVDYSTDIKKHSFANIRWSRHIIVFIDSLLQIYFPISPLKELIVPVVFPLIRCDPVMLFEAIKRNNIAYAKEETLKVDEYVGVDVDEAEMDSKLMDEMRTKLDKITDEADEIQSADSIIRAYHDAECQTVAAPGIEIVNFYGVSISRKMDPVTIESYGFVPHCETISMSKDKLTEAIEYINTCTSECRQLCEQLKLDGSYFSQTWDEMSQRDKCLSAKDGNSLLKLINQARANSASVSMDTKLDSSTNVSTLFRNSIFQLCNFASDPNNNKIDEYAHKRIILNYLHTDPIANLACEERLTRPLVDLVAENLCYLKDLSVVQLSPVQMLPLSLMIDKYLAASSVSKLNINCTLTHPLIDRSNEIELPLNFTELNWNNQVDCFWPTNLPLKQTPHLIVLYDEPLLQELLLNNESFWVKVSQSLHPTGFVLILFRSKLNHFERFVYEEILRAKLPTDQAMQQRINETVKIALRSDFLTVAFKSDDFGHNAVLLRKNQFCNEQNSLKMITFQHNEDMWLQTVQNNLRATSDAQNETIWILADGKTLPGVMGFFNCLRKEAGGKQFRLLYLPEEEHNGDVNDLFEKHRQTLLKQDLAVNVYQNNTFGSYRHLTQNLFNSTRLSHEYHLNMGQKNYLNSLALYDSTHLQQLSIIPNETNCSQVRKYAVYSSGINFRDVMVAIGRIYPPVDLLTLNCCLGTEFAGRDHLTGERVFGFCMGGCYATTIYVDPIYVRPMPSHWSYDDAAGASTVYFTVWYGLIYKAQLKPKSTVLIHNASGGVGQAALHVCKAFGCTIFATAGSEEKRLFVQEKFKIPADHIFSSRDCQFEQDIRRLTNGKGVKYILNSLIGDKLDASLRLVADNGHFIELAKYEMQYNKRIGTFSFLRNLTYHGIAIENPMVNELDTVSAFFDWFLQNSQPNHPLQPITSNVFPLENAIAAFSFMKSGQHIGKVLLRVRDDDDPKLDISKHIPLPRPMNVQTSTFFDPRKSYILVGGCGGVGLELAHWLVRKGAKRIVLTSRSVQRTPYQTASLGYLDASGRPFPYYTNNISVYTEDISSEEGIRQMITQTQKHMNAPIGGVFHLAVKLNDCTVENMTSDLWHQTIDSKATSALFLDKATREMCPNMDFFVCFSSVAAGRGNVGQANYAYANAVLDNLCERRRRDGLHGLSLQYGPIGDVGLLSEANERLSTFANVQAQRIISCLDVLNRAMQSEFGVLSSTVFVDRSKQENTSNEDYLVQSLWSALGVDPDTLPDHVTLGELGMESMFAVEMQRSIEQDYNVRLSIQEVKLITAGDLKNTYREKLQKQLRQIKEFTEYLQTLNLLLPQSSIEYLNSHTEGRPIFFLPNVIGNFDQMRVLAQNLNQPAIGLNITREMNKNNKSVKLMAKFMMKFLKENFANIKQFNLVGFDYGALVALKMARKGFACRVAVIDVRQNIKINVKLKENKLYDQLIEFVMETLLVKTFAENATNEKHKERILRSVHKVTELEDKVKSISHEILKVRIMEKDQIEKMEELLTGALLRAKALFEYDNKMSNNKMNKLTERLLEMMAKAEGRLLVMRNESSLGLFTRYFSNDDVKNSAAINLHQELLTTDSSANLLNNFFRS